jgi:hypothetical protein
MGQDERIESHQGCIDHEKDTNSRKQAEFAANHGGLALARCALKKVTSKQFVLPNRLESRF